MQIMGFIQAFVLCQNIQCKIILFIATSNLLAILFIATSNLLSVGPRSEKFNIVSNNHGFTQKLFLRFSR